MFFLCCCFYLTPFWFLDLTRCYFADLISWFMKAVQELQGKKTRKEDRRPRYLLYFDIISGFNNYSVGQEIIPESK